MCLYSQLAELCVYCSCVSIQSCAELRVMIGLYAAMPAGLMARADSQLQYRTNQGLSGGRTG